MRKIVIPIIAVMLLSGCFEDSDCATDYTNIAIVRFYNRETKELEEQAFTTVFIRENDSILATNTATSRFNLPLRPGAAMTTFRFDTDSLALGYRARASLKGLNCDAEQVFDGLSVMTTSFDSVVVIQNVLDKQLDENIRIYR